MRETKAKTNGPARFPKFTAKDKAEALKILRTTDPQLIRTWSMGVL